jgi:ER degradation enhancer, mannosidase alpha-like 1
VGHYTIRPGQIVYINDSTIFADAELPRKPLASAEVQLRFLINIVDPMFRGFLDADDLSDDLHALVSAFTAHFAGNPSTPILPNGKRLRFANLDGLVVRQDTQNSNGCDKYQRLYTDNVLVVRRGGCTFLEKLIQARDVGAAGVVVISDEDGAINPTANTDEVEAAGDINDIVITLLPHRAGAALEAVMTTAEQAGWEVLMKLETELEDAPQPVSEPKKDPNRILYINGHPLLNTRLLV